MTSNANFEKAKKAARNGSRILRLGWNGFVFMQIPATIPQEIIPNMQSLPQSVKDAFIRRGGSIHYCNQMARVTAINENDNMITAWTPSIEDIFAEDWIILD